MSKAKAARQAEDDDVHEIYEIDPTRIDAVGQAANKTAFLLIKSVAPAREAFRRNAQRVRARRPKKKAKAKKARSRIAQPSAMAASAAPGYSHEIPATGTNEADSILRSVTGESGQTCGGMTRAGTPCRRPSGMCRDHN